VSTGRIHGRRRGKVLALETDRGSGTTSRRRLTNTATAQQLSGGEGGGPAARGAAPNSTEAHVPAHEDEKQVRWRGGNRGEVQRWQLTKGGQEALA
jgi:hypothetical protein